jgi:acyl-CoA hydrolase
MDMCAAMSAYKHARTAVVTASVDRLDFLAPAKMGEIMILKSSVNYTGKSSMEVGVRIESENPKTGDIYHTSSAYLTFVSLNENGKPKRVDNINPENNNEIRRFNEGKIRHEERKERLRKDRK